MTDGHLDPDAMMAEVRRAAISYLPEEPNATWKRPGTPSETSIFGEPSGVTEDEEWPVRIFPLRYIRSSGETSQAGIHERAMQEMLVSFGEGDGESDPPSIALGDVIHRGDITWRVNGFERQEVDDHRYWVVVGERLHG